MNIEEQFQIEHLYLTDRKCRVCGKTKNLIDGFYRTRKNKYQPSAYAYECKECTVKRVIESRKKSRDKPDIPYNPVPRFGPDIYPDW